jgi:hypothetical protein
MKASPAFPALTRSPRFPTTKEADHVLINEAAIESDNGRSADLLAVVESYFELSDAGSAETLDPFAEDVRIYFPVFGHPNWEIGLRVFRTGVSCQGRCDRRQPG